MRIKVKVVTKTKKKINMVEKGKVKKVRKVERAKKIKVTLVKPKSK